MSWSYIDFLRRINKMMKREFPESKAWALIVDDGSGEVWDVAGFDIDRVAKQWVAERQKELSA